MVSVREAFADARTDAKVHFRKGMEAIAQARYADGIVELEAAYDLAPHPSVLYNIARARALNGDLRGAINSYKRYLDGAPADKEEVEKTVADLESRLPREAPAQIDPEPSAPIAPTPVDAGAGDSPETPRRPAPSLPARPAELGVGPARPEDVFEESVVTASQGNERPLDAAASTSIITQQDIRLSGLTRIPELLRRLAGLDVMTVTGSHSDVSIRGFNQRLSNRVLVLVDGRSVYSDFLGATFWQSLSIGVDDIKQIEVVRGPGSALYGAVALNGVVNIITKTPEDGKGGARFGVGSFMQTHASVWLTGREGGFGWRASGGFDSLPRWSREVSDTRTDVRTGVRDQNTSGRTYRVDLRGRKDFSKRVALTVGGGTALGSMEALGVGTLNSLVMPQFTSSDVSAGLTAGVFESRVYFTRFETETTLNSATFGQSLLPARADQNVLNGEVLLRLPFETGPITHRLTVGGNYRYKNIAYTFLDSRRVENHGSLFLQEQAKLGQYVTASLDYRLDYVPYLQSFVQSPRGALVVHPSKLSALRASIATAFRPPTFLEAYLDAPIQLPATGGALKSQGFRQDDPTFRLKPESLLSAELGYLHHFTRNDGDFAVLEASLYYNRVSSLIQLADARAITLGDVARGLGAFEPQTGLFPLFFGGFENQCQRTNAYGAELAARFFPAEGVDVHANYTLNLSQVDFSPCAQPKLSSADQRTSTHKVNLGAQVRTKLGITAGVDFHLASSQVWVERVVSRELQRIESAPFALPTYSLLNAQLGYRFWREHAEVSAAVYNALNIEQRQHPFGQVLGRRLMVFFTYTF
jgi:outer membrane receptor protein involved in Fe transport